MSMNAELDYKRYAFQLEDTLELVQERLSELEFAQEDVGWIRLDGDGDYEFSFQALKRAIARSRLFFIANPLIHRAVSLQSDYVFAQGLNIQATSKLVNDVIQSFVDDRTNKKEITGHQARLMKEQTLMLDGNVFLVLFTDVSNTGRVQVRTILVDEIIDIITNPNDANEVWFYKRQWIEKNSEKFDSTPKYALYPDIDYKPDSTKRQKTRNGIKIHWDAPIYHVKVGGLAKSRYGIPETYSALDWAKAHQSFLQDWATIVKMYARFAFRLTVTNSKNSVAAAKTKLGTTVNSGIGDNAVDGNPSPSVGSIFTRKKDGADIEPIKTSGATTAAEDGREILMMVAAALGIPVTFFGLMDVGNLATARTLDRPTELKFRSRQQLWTQVFQDIIEYQIKWAILAPKGKLNKYATFTIGTNGELVFNAKNDPETNKPIDLHVEVVFPPILEHSITERIEAITNAVTLNGKEFAVDSPELIKLTIRLMFQALSLNDVDELVDAVFKGIDLQAQIAAKHKAALPSNDSKQPGSNNQGQGGGRRPGSSDTTKDQKSSDSQESKDFLLDDIKGI